MEHAMTSPWQGAGCPSVTALSQFATLQAERQPDATAVVMSDERLTYGELETLSNRLAGALRKAGCQRGDRVCLLLPKSPAAVVGILAVLKTGGVYVPLDTTSPASRLARMITACEPRAILAAGATAALVDELAGMGCLGAEAVLGWMDAAVGAAAPGHPAFARADWPVSPDAPELASDRREDPAYILFTSGSTGVPKGVVITHANVVHFVEWATRYFAIDDQDRVSGHSPLSFDLSTFDLFGAFASGAALYLVPPELNLLPNKLADFIRESALTQWFSVPSALSYMANFDVVRFGDFPALKRVLWCGEVLPTPVLAYWMRRLPHVTFTNLYGPTEATVASGFYTVPACPADERAPIPIGTACEGEELLVLDEQRRPVAPGESGEIYIGGVGLSPGYWRDEEKTRRAFLPDPRSADPAKRLYRTGDLGRLGEDGLVYFLGRTDTQIKSRGYRIELGEIEASLHALPGLKESAVVATHTGGFEGAVICCAYVPLGPGEVTPTDLRHALRAVLPPHMLPTRWLVLEALPRTSNAKIDRQQLREEFAKPWS